MFSFSFACTYGLKAKYYFLCAFIVVANFTYTALVHSCYCRMKYASISYFDIPATYTYLQY